MRTVQRLSALGFLAIFIVGTQAPALAGTTDECGLTAEQRRSVERYGRLTGFCVLIPDTGLELSPLAPVVPDRCARFHGFWTGSWDGNVQPGMLAVLDLKFQNGACQALTLYAVGWNSHRPFDLETSAPGFVKKLATINGSQLTFSGQVFGGDVSFKLQSDGSLRGEGAWPDPEGVLRSAWIEMKRRDGLHELE